KALRDFAKANPLLVVKGGYFDGAALTPAEVGKLADLESREVLLAKLAGAFKASLFGAAYLINATLAQAVRTVDALRRKQEAASCTSHRDGPSHPWRGHRPGARAPQLRR